MIKEYKHVVTNSWRKYKLFFTLEYKYTQAIHVMKQINLFLDISTSELTKSPVLVSPLNRPSFLYFPPFIFPQLYIEWLYSNRTVSMMNFYKAGVYYIYKSSTKIFKTGIMGRNDGGVNDWGTVGGG